MIARRTILKSKDLYTIGEVSKICNVSKKTLRFYDQINLISPDYISEETKYRYYSQETLLFVPVIKYYKQMGFRLEEMKVLLDSESYETHINSFRNKIDELTLKKEDINIAYKSVTEWYNLIHEAESVIKYNATEVSIKYIDEFTAPCMVQDFSGHYMESIINIELTNLLEEINQAIYGPVIMYFPNAKEKYNKLPTKAVVFQHNAKEIESGETITVGGKMMISAYHIGSHENINATYDKMYKWAEEHEYVCSESSIERYVTDYWTIKDSKEYVTEILLEIIE